MATSKRNTADSYTLRARKEGYPARSVYKLEEIQKVFRIIRPGAKVLDVGAAPGSWTLYVHREILKGKGSIVAVDLNPLSLNPLPPSVMEFTGDAFSEDIRSLLVVNGPYDAIISDAAPMTTGNRMVDVARSENLAESVLSLAREHLKPHGNLVIKIFQGGGHNAVLADVKKYFIKSKTFKPAACRSDSFETYIIGLDLKKEVMEKG
ncbi:SAM-dependent methyltransferase [Parasphaerochaeta coccoides]|uniref:Ribosomal RNA large subunit methyltransferase E n=1 Tax=Parasphaerochaeta coccoides (strain ATCC BAA-1237 / DSM 17374 / SPN1) TaxID=760011 RepID=F4GJ39_PARC1|nr:RlmE family RNA methyltransferase [Parasphaerochaeta coccoides]AEC01334.1 Ribosomal RNA large subunit methyltransferase E [Parasphaerochaeta coccoides DSM 17374]